MQRRHFLATVGAASASLAGCTGANMPQDAIVKAVQKSASADVSGVSYDELPQVEQQIARTAMEKDFYHVCPDLPNAIRSFADRFEQPENAYLQYQGTNYALWIRIEDTVRAGTASPPESEPSCGFL